MSESQPAIQQDPAGGPATQRTTKRALRPSRLIAAATLSLAALGLSMAGNLASAGGNDPVWTDAANEDTVVEPTTEIIGTMVVTRDAPAAANTTSN